MFDRTYLELDLRGTRSMLQNCEKLLNVNLVQIVETVSGRVNTSKTLVKARENW